MVDCDISIHLDNKGYSIAWKDIIRPSVLKRDGYKCVYCKVSNHTKFTVINRNRLLLDDTWLLDKYILSGHKISTIHLSIAHTCHVKACTNREHLKSSCQACHLRLDKHQHVLNRLASHKNYVEKRKRLSQS